MQNLSLGKNDPYKINEVKFESFWKIFFYIS